MRSAEDPQADFAGALRDLQAPALPHWIDATGTPSTRRFGVYRNNVIAGLARTLAESFPVVCRLVGHEFFHAMACEYARQELPQSPVLQEYGSTFADFIELFEPAAPLPYLADVARFERAWVESYHERDMATPVPDQQALARLDPDRQRIELHPSLRVVRSKFPVRSIWSRHQDDPSPRLDCRGEGDEDTLLVRPAAEVLVIALSPGAAIFVETLRERGSLQLAFESASAAAPGFDLVSALRALSSSGAFAALETA